MLFFLQLFRIITLTNDTHYRSLSHKESFPLTINPGYSNAFKECNPQKAHTTGCIVVKELEHIHAALQKDKKESCINYQSDEVEGKKVTEIEGSNKAGGWDVLEAAHKNAGTLPIEAEFNRC